jgi:hypothetical protein
MLKQPPSDKGKDNEADRSNRSPYTLNARHLSAPLNALETALCFFSSFVLFDHHGTGGKNRGEGQEEAADSGTKFLGDQTGKDRNRSSKDKTNGIFVPLRLSEITGLNSNPHLFSPQDHIPKAKGATKPDGQA